MWQSPNKIDAILLINGEGVWLQYETRGAKRPPIAILIADQQKFP